MLGSSFGCLEFCNDKIKIFIRTGSINSALLGCGCCKLLDTRVQFCNSQKSLKFTPKPSYITWKD